MKASWESIQSGLDQLLFTPFGDSEFPQDRADAIVSFLHQNGWTWDEVIAEMAKPDALMSTQN